MDQYEWSLTCIWTSVPIAASSTISIASPSSMTLTSLFAQSDKGTSTSSVSEQNTIANSEQSCVSFWTLGDAFSQILQEAFSGNAPHSSPSTETPNANQIVQGRNLQTGEPIAKNQVQTAALLETNSLTVPDTDTPGEVKSASIPVPEKANTNVAVTAQILRSPLAQVANENSQPIVLDDTSATKDAEASAGRSKPKPAPRSDKNQAELGPLGNSSPPLQLMADSSGKLVVPIAPVPQTASFESSLTQHPAAKIADTAPTVALPDVSKDGSQVATNAASLQFGLPWTRDDTSDKEVFHLSLQSSSPQDLKPKQTDQAAQSTASASVVIPNLTKATQTASTASENPTVSTTNGNSSEFEKVQAPHGVGGDSGMNSDSEAAPPKSSPLLGKDRSSMDGEKKNESIDLPPGGTTFAAGSSSFGLSTNPATGKEASAPAQSSMVNQPTDLQQAATGSPAREVTVRLQGDSGETISIRLTDQSGQVQVAVRSTDTGSVASLRQDLSSLTSSLDRIGWKAEVSNNVAASNNMSGQDSSGSGNNSREDNRNGSPDWEQGSRRQRNTTSEMWDEILYRQSN